MIVISSARRALGRLFPTAVVPLAGCRSIRWQGDPQWRPAKAFSVITFQLDTINTYSQF